MLGAGTSSSSRLTSQSLALPLIVSFLLLIISFLGGGLTIALVTLVVLVSFSRIVVLGQWLLDLDEGTDKMRLITDAIREGSESFFHRVYGTIGKLATPMAFGLVLLYGFRGHGSNGEEEEMKLGRIAEAAIVGVTFLVGALCSGIAGFAGLWVSVRANGRTTAAAMKLVGTPGSTHPIVVALQGGAIAAVVVVGLVVLGVALMYAGLRLVVGDKMDETETPMLLVGFGFGASFVALFAQLGGGIFTKAADVGADLVGKIEANIPEDDPRNPAVIADLVGDMVGDCAARGADLFESISAEIISSMILGGSLAKAVGMSESETRGYVLFPLVVHAMDLIASGIGVAGAVRAARGAGPDLDPLDTLKRGHRIAQAAALVGLAASTRIMLYTDKAPFACWYFFACSAVGAAAGYAAIAIAGYYTDVPHAPVQSIIKASESGPATNVIAGLSVGMTSTGPSVIVVGAAILASYWLGEAAGLSSSSSSNATTGFGGLFGTAVATMGCLSCGAYVLAMDVFGPISDNAGGISEMSEQPPAVRDITDKLDAVGNSTKAATKSFALSSATLASFLLLRAFMDEVQMLTGKPFSSVDVTRPEVFVAGLAGSTLIFVFAGYATSAVGEAAGDVVAEVRRQFREIPGIMDGTGRPQYGVCVDIVARRALELMILPGLLAVIAPIAIGLLFRLVGFLRFAPDNSNNEASLMGPRAIVGFLVFNTATGILMGLFLSNAGGSWDNAKKGIEARGSSGAGGKGSKTHHAAVVGDTVGDPLKDTAGPSLHVVIKLVSTTVLVTAPLFIG